jgi:DNA-binding MurR/RpiR family transcriptional regulator
MRRRIVIGWAALAQPILDHCNDMARGERRLADVLLANGTAILDSSAIQLAARAGVSKAIEAGFFRRLGDPNRRAPIAVTERS